MNPAKTPKAKSRLKTFDDWLLLGINLFLRYGVIAFCALIALIVLGNAIGLYSCDLWWCAR